MKNDSTDSRASASDSRDVISPDRQNAMQEELARQRRSEMNLSDRAAPKNTPSPQAAQPVKGGEKPDTTQLLKNLAAAAMNPKKELPKQALKLAYDMWKQVAASRDWPYLFILIPFSALKDLFDIAFAAIPGVGIAISFISTVLIVFLTAIFLVIISGDLRARKAGRYLVGPFIEFVTEAFPGIGWLPLCFVETVLIYFVVLLERTLQQPAEENQENTPSQLATADGYEGRQAA